MGLQFLDQYSFLHFASGVVAYFFGIPFNAWFFINIVFEVFENSEFGMNIINKITFWPGGKTFPDAFINIVGDIISVMLGWAAAYGIDYLGKKYEWFPKNL
jgi:hypothetical protein